MLGKPYLDVKARLWLTSSGVSVLVSSRPKSSLSWVIPIGRVIGDPLDLEDRSNRES